MSKRLVARFESKRGAHWVALYCTDAELPAGAFRYWYEASGGQGTVPGSDDGAATAYVAARTHYHLPDDAKTPMRRTV
jgi:hypothetical protein